MAARGILPPHLPQPPDIWAQVLHPRGTTPLPKSKQQLSKLISTLIPTQMSYTPPRGPCKHSNSILQTCACFRFMVHPLKAASSFNCDGCGHHACFHRMENPVDDEAALKWSRRRSSTRVEEEEVDDGVDEEHADSLLNPGILNQLVKATLASVTNGDKQDKPKRRRITNTATTGSTSGRKDVVTVDLVAPDRPTRVLGKRRNREQDS